MNIEISHIPKSSYPDYRTNVMFDGYKWDLQAGEQSTISDKVILLEPDEAAFLADTAVKLYHETIAMEAVLKHCPQLALAMGISEKMTEALCNCEYDQAAHVRFMRFDFHPTTQGWRVSEVNSDVPAGYPEASVLPALAQVYFDGYCQYGCFGQVLTNRLSRLVPGGATIAYLHDTHTVEDYQILRYIGDLMETRGYKSMYAAPEHIPWADNKAKGIGGVLRYFPIEWMEFNKNTDWLGFVNSQTPSCNHPVALLTQSKRLPLVWDRLGVEISTWKAMLPETICPSQVLEKHSSATNANAQWALPEEGWILKPAFGRVGEGITIPGSCPAKRKRLFTKPPPVSLPSGLHRKCLTASRWRVFI